MPLIETACATENFIEPVTEAVNVMFDSMFGCGVRRTAVAKTNSDSVYDLSSLVGLAGDYSGSMCLSMPVEAIFALVKAAVDIELNEINRLCRDTINELVNVIAGYAKDRLVEDDIKLGLPTAVQGAGVAINFPQNSEPIRLDFESELGRLMVIIGLVRKPKNGDFE